MQNFKNMAKRLLALVLALVLMGSLIPDWSPLADLGLVTKAEAAMSGYSALTDSSSLPTSGKYYLAVSEFKLTSDWTISGNLYLDLNGYTINLNGHHIVVNGTLYLYDSDPNWRQSAFYKKGDVYNYIYGGLITGGKSGYGGAVQVNKNGTLEMHGGTIYGNTATTCGGGVHVNGGKFIMYGGSIENNKLSAGKVKEYYAGGGVSVFVGTFTMYGGKIKNNSSNSCAGGVFVNDGATFYMYDGEISGNSASSDCGGVFIRGGTGDGYSDFYLYGGEISGNSAKYGGGVYPMKGSDGHGGTFYYGGSDGKSGYVKNNKSSKGGNDIAAWSGTVKFNGGRLATNFGGWYCDPPNKTDYTITFNKAGGTGGDSSVSPIRWKAELPTIKKVPTRTGYDFLGYFNAAEGGVQYYNKSGSPVDRVGDGTKWDYFGNQTLYAQWEEHTATLTYDENGHGTAPKSVTMKYSAATTAADALPDETGYTFAGWNTLPSGTGVNYEAGEIFKEANNDPTSDTVGKKLYANWVANPYYVSYNANGGSGAPNRDALTYDKAANLTEVVPTRAGYVFTGWNTKQDGSGTAYAKGAEVKNLTDVKNATITLYAQWKPSVYALELLSNDDVYGVNGESGFIKITPESGYVDYPDATATDTKKKPATATDMLTDEGALWMTYGTMTLPSAEELGMKRNHYDFVGWNIYDGQDWAMYKPGITYKVGLTPEDGGKTQLFAAWKMKDNFTITYNANGGVGGPAQDYKFQGDNLILPDASKNPTRPGYTFDGWCTDPNGGKSTASGTSIVYKPGTEYTKVQGNVTFYAQWILNKTVSFNANGGVFSQSPAVLSPAAGETVMVPFDNLPTLTGYEFVGWSTVQQDKGVTTQIDYWNEIGHDTFTMDENAVTLYAVWKQKSYTVTYNGESAGRVAAGAPTSVLHGNSLKFTVEVDTTKYNADNMKVSVNGSLLAIPQPTGAGNTKSYQFTVNNATRNQTVEIAGIKGQVYGLALYPRGGTVLDNRTTYTFGVATDLPTAERTGYTFDGWFDNKNLTGDPVTTIGAEETGNKTFYAKWTANSYTISYHANGGSGTPTNLNMTYDESQPLADGTGMTYNNYDFLGWSTDAYALTPTYQPGQKVRNLAESGDVTLYAVWRLPKSETAVLTYDSNGVSALDMGARVVKKGAKVTLEFPEESSYCGKQFLGWSKQTNVASPTWLNGGENNTLDVSENTTLYAVWQTITGTYNVIYDANGGEGEIASQTVLFASPTTLATNSSLSNGNKKFLGWSTNSEAKEPEYLAGAKVKYLATEAGQDVILFAVWSEAERTFVAFDAGEGCWPDGSTMKVVERTPGASLPTNPTRPGYAFVNWKDGETDGVVIQHISALAQDKHTVYAQWNKIEQYTVTYHNGGETATVTALMGSPTTLSYPTGLAKEAGKEFKGWAIASGSDLVVYLDGQTITYPAQATLDLYAVWKGEELYLTYDDNGGSGGPGVVTVYKNAVATVSDIVPVYEGHQFQGWDDNGTLRATGTSLGLIEKSKTLYASWTELAECTVTYDANEGYGVPVDPNIHYVGDEVSLLFSPEPTRVGYHFTGWNTKQDGKGELYTKGNRNITLTKDVTLYAQWEANTYSILFDANGVSGEMASKTDILYGSPTDLDPNEFAAPEGMEFAGWSTAKGGSVIYEDKATVINLTAEDGGVVTLYAVWKDGAYAITLRNHSDLSSDTTLEKVVKGQPLPTPNKAPTRMGYTFAGYYAGENGTGEQYYDAALNGLKLFDLTTDTDLHAKWIPQTFRVIYMQDGQEIGKDTVTYGQSYIFSNTALDGTVIKGVTKLAGWSKTGEDKVDYAAKSELSVDNVNKLWDAPNNGNDITLFAVLKDDTEYTVTYNANGGVNFPVDENGYTEGDKADIVCTGTDLPTKANYVFQGWASKPNAEAPDAGFEAGKTDGKLTITKNVILYAVWKPVDYTVTFHANGGKLASNSNLATMTVLVTYDSESKAELLPAANFTRDGYDLVAWARDEKGTVVVGLPGDSMSQTMTGGKACTLYAVWSAKGCDVTFNENYKAAGGSTPTDTTTYAYDAKLGTLPTPEREGYKFDGWYKAVNCTGTAVDKTTLVKDVVTAKTLKGTLYAKWSAKDYVINFSSDCGATASYTNAQGEALKTNVIGKPVAPYETTVRFKVNYKTDKYTGITVYYNDKPLTATGTDKHYEFTAGTENTLRVEATGYKYTIVYHDSEKTYSQPAVSTDTSLKLASETTFTRSGYKLTGWATRSGGQIAYDPGQTVTDALTTVPGGRVDLYAVWMARPSEITFMNGTETVTSFSRGYDDALGTLPTVSKDGYQFVAWIASGTDMSVNGNTKVSDILAEQHKNPESPITLNAKWSPRDYAISVKSDCGANVNYTSGNVSTPTIITKAKAPFDATVKFTVTYETKYTGVTVYYNDKPLTATGTDMHYEFTVETENELRIEATGYQYTIVYHSNHDTDKATATQLALSTDTSLHLASETTFNRPGYKLTGWATRASGSLAYEAGEVADRPLTERPGDEVNLYAVWNSVDCTVTFNDNYEGSASPTDATYAYDAKLGTLPKPEREGYQFEGWYKDAKCTEGTAVDKTTLVKDVVNETTLDGTLYAKWSVSNCPISVSTNCGAKASYTNLSVVTLPGSIFGKPKAPYRATVQFKVIVDDDYTGVKVYHNGKECKATGTNLDLYEFTVDTENELRIDATGYQYTIVYHSNFAGSTATDIVTAFSTDTNLKLASETTFTRPGYELTGWATRAIGAAEFEPDGVAKKPLTTEPGDTVDLYAKWQDMTCTITLDYDDTTGKKGIYKYDYSKLLGTLPVPTREGYKFVGWYTESGKPVESTTEVSSLVSQAEYTGSWIGTLIAHWTPNPYPVTVQSNCLATATILGSTTNLNGAEFPFATKTSFTVTYDTDKYTGVTVKHNGKALTASGTDYTFTVSTENVITVDYADYKYTVIYDANGGTGGTVKQPASGTELLKLKATDTNFKKEGYELVGWTENVQGGVRYGLGDKMNAPLCTEPGGEKILYAVWMSQPSKITFWTENKTDGQYDYVDAYTLDYTDPLGELPVVTRDGYTFDGWYVGTNTDLHPNPVTKETKVSTIVSAPKAPVDLYAKWSAAECKITIESDCGATFKKHTETALLTAAPASSGYIKSDEAPYGSTYQFTITYDTALYPSVTVKVNNVVVTPNADGVYTINSVDTVNVITVTADAYYYHVTYNDNGGTATPTDVPTKATMTSLATNTNVLAGKIFERTGYTMAGWALAEDGDVVYGFDQNITTPLTSIPGGNVDLYAVWHAEYNKATIEGYEATYDGINHVIRVDIQPHEDWLKDITYQWYKDGHLLNGATQRDFKVKNVADSGEYYCVVKATEIETGSNKQYTTNTATVNIERKVATATALDRSVVYGNDLPTFAFNYDGFVAGETKAVITGTPTVTAELYAAGNGVGTYTDIVKVNTTDNSGETVVAGISADNYTFVAGDPATLTVTPRPLTVKWNRTTFFYTGFAHTVTAEPTNLFGDDVVELIYEGRQSATRPGDYVVKVVGCDRENYMIPGGEISHNWSIGRWAEGDETPMTDIAILPNTLDLVVGDTEEITATVGLESLLSSPVTWTSSDKGIVKVASDSNLTATVTAVNVGTAEITVTTGEGYSASCFVTVTEKIPASATDLRLSKHTAIITTHEGTVDLDISMIGFNSGRTLVCESDDELVATATVTDLDGEKVLQITADDNGTATITVTMLDEDGNEIVTDTCDVTVFVSDTKVVESILEDELRGKYVITYTDGSEEVLNMPKRVKLDFDTLITSDGVKAVFDGIKSLLANRPEEDTSNGTVSNDSVYGDTYGNDSTEMQQTILYSGGKDGVGIVSIEKTGTKDNVDTYTINYSDGTTSTFIVTNGVDGHTPVITIGSNGNWFIDGVDTGKVAVPKTANILSIVAISSSGITLAGLIYLLFRNRKLEAILMGKK